MRFRPFGRGRLLVSELGFGAWGIGGTSYGHADKSEALSALARAEELGCNLADTAAVYGDSEAIIGEFLRGRRDRWFVATKYSGQRQGLTATLDAQLRRIGSEEVDLYQLHWVPRGRDARLLDELLAVKRAGKARFVGVSAYSVTDLDTVLERGDLDAVMLPFSLLDPFPFLARVDRLRKRGIAVLVRSVLKEGFLSGRFDRDTVFTDSRDQRHKLSREQVAEMVERVERFRFLEGVAASMPLAAIGYPLSFPEVSCVLVGTKSVGDAKVNFGEAPGKRLSVEVLKQIRKAQIELRLGTWRERWPLALRGMLGR